MLRNQMEEKPPAVIKKIPWWDDTLTITGSNTGIEGLSAAYLGDTMPLIGFLNNCLAFEHAELRDDIITKYEKLLGVDDIFDLDPPEIPENRQRLDPAACESNADDAALVAALLKDYAAKMETLKAYFAEKEKIFADWYNEQKKG